MALKQLSLADLYLGWTLVLALVLAPIALAKSPNDLWSILDYLAAAAGVAALVAAWLAVPMWLVIKLVS